MKIEILLHSQLINDALSRLLINAGFAVFHAPTQGNDCSMTLVDFDGCKSPDTIGSHRARDVKIVALINEADSREIEPGETALLSGILTYDISADTFVRSLRLIHSGERLFPRHLADRQRAQPPPSGTMPRSDGDRLSPREKEILSQVVHGRSNKTIARQLGIAEATVKVHFKSVLRKIRLENRTQAAIWALANLAELGA